MTLKETQLGLPGVEPPKPMPPLDVDVKTDDPVTQTSAGQFAVPTLPGDLVRVSDSLKVGDHILNVSAENVPIEMAATTLADFVATLSAAAALASINPPALSDVPSGFPPAASVPASPIAPAQDAPEPPVAPLAPPPGGLAAVVDQGTLAALRERGIAAPPVAAPAEAGAKIVTIPAAEITQVRRADTENGAHRVKFFTKKWHQHGIICWEEQQNEDVIHPLEGIVEVGTMQPGTQYKCPPKIKAINVRMKTPEGGGRPTPDRVISVVT